MKADWIRRVKFSLCSRNNCKEKRFLFGLPLLWDFQYIFADFQKAFNQKFDGTRFPEGTLGAVNHCQLSRYFVPYRQAYCKTPFQRFSKFKQTTVLTLTWKIFRFCRPFGYWRQISSCTKFRHIRKFAKGFTCDKKKFIYDRSFPTLLSRGSLHNLM